MPRLGRTFGKGIVVIFAVIGLIASVQRLRGQSATPMAGFAVTHVGIIVRDMDKTIQYFEEIFGIDVPAPTEFGPLSLPADVPGREQSRVKIVQFKLGDLSIELLQPLRGPGPHRDHLEKFGQGLHHIAFSVKNLESTIGFLLSKGGKRTLRGYADLKEQLGFTVELSQTPAL